MVVQKNLQSIQCPHCGYHTPYENEMCDNCGKEVFDFEIKQVDEEQLAKDYMEYSFAPEIPTTLQKSVVCISFFLLLICFIWVLKILAKVEGSHKIPQLIFLISGMSIAAIAATELFIYKEKRKFRIHMNNFGKN